MQDNITIEVNGTEYNGFQDIRCRTSMNEFVATFSFSGSIKFLIENGARSLLDIVNIEDDIIVRINGIKYLKGVVYDINSTDDGISIQGGDVTVHLQDSTILPKTYKQRNFKLLLEQVLKDNGWSDFIKVESIIPETLLLGENEEVKTENNETIFNFMQRYAEKVQVLLYTLNNGNILIYREGLVYNAKGRFPNDSNSTTALIKQFNNPTNNILSSNFSQTLSGRFKTVEVYSQGSNDFEGVNSIIQTGTAQDGFIKSPRRVRIQYSIPTESASLKNYAKWRTNLKRAQSRRYTAKVQGFRMQPSSVEFWRINTYVQVFDDRHKVNGEFLIESVEFNKSLQGTSTILTIVDKGTYTLDVNKALQRLNRNSFGS